MLIHAGLNTHSNRISVKKLKEDGKKPSVLQKNEFHGNCCSQKIQSVAACSTKKPECCSSMQQKVLLISRSP
ncbi:hypothetical protein SSSV4_ORF71 [Sulfolobus spindle-shaped virus 4]|uniref:Uncharacterized protein n=1 Tax=Sulfolobus spindle-shaped virus 4 TaxID=459290 RepID=A8TKH5_9VIRU|nr:hypothetical protein SSSV4_ORF71 [Sulfolobus spindle-shaped virus 4]ABV26201.1 hypothetical protein [Sulfolobus spindle-shaped virus 4]